MIREQHKQKQEFKTLELDQLGAQDQAAQNRSRIEIGPVAGLNAVQSVGDLKRENYLISPQKRISKISKLTSGLDSQSYLDTLSSYGAVGQAGIISNKLQSKVRQRSDSSKIGGLSTIQQSLKMPILMNPEDWNKQPPLIKIQTPQMKPLRVSTYKSQAKMSTAEQANTKKRTLNSVPVSLIHEPATVKNHNRLQRSRDLFRHKSNRNQFQLLSGCSPQQQRHLRYLKEFYEAKRGSKNASSSPTLEPIKMQNDEDGPQDDSCSIEVVACLQPQPQPNQVQQTAQNGVYGISYVQGRQSNNSSQLQQYDHTVGSESVKLPMRHLSSSLEEGVSIDEDRKIKLLNSLPQDLDTKQTKASTTKMMTFDNVRNLSKVAREIGSYSSLISGPVTIYDQEGTTRENNQGQSYQFESAGGATGPAVAVRKQVTSFADQDQPYGSSLDPLTSQEVVMSQKPASQGLHMRQKSLQNEKKLAQQRADQDNQETGDYQEEVINIQNAANGIPEMSSHRLSQRADKNLLVSAKKSDLVSSGSKKVSVRDSISNKKKNSVHTSARKFLTQYQAIEKEIQEQALLPSQRQAVIDHDKLRSQSSDDQNQPEVEPKLQEKVELVDRHLTNSSSKRDNVMIQSIHKMPEPSRKYVAKERSGDERHEIVNQLQNMLMFKEISAGFQEAQPDEGSDNSIQNNVGDGLPLDKSLTDAIQDNDKPRIVGDNSLIVKPSNEGAEIRLVGSQMKEEPSNIPLRLSHRRELNGEQNRYEDEELQLIKSPGQHTLSPSTHKQKETIHIVNLQPRSQSRAELPMHLSYAQSYAANSNQSTIQVNQAFERKDSLYSNDFPAIKSITEAPTQGNRKESNQNSEKKRLHDRLEQISLESKIRDQLVNKKSKREFVNEGGSSLNADQQAQMDYNFSNRFEKKEQYAFKSSGVSASTKQPPEIHQKRNEERSQALLLNSIANTVLSTSSARSPIDRQPKSKMNKKINNQGAKGAYKAGSKVEFVNFLKDNNAMTIKAKYIAPTSIKKTASKNHSKSQKTMIISNDNQSMNSLDTSAQKLLPKDLSIVSSARDEPLQGAKKLSVGKSQSGYIGDLEFKTLKQKQLEVTDKISTQKQSLTQSIKKIDSQATQQMMDYTKQSYQELIKNRQLISKFDPKRKEHIVKLQLTGVGNKNYRDYPRLNILETQPNEHLVKNIVQINFKKIFDQNLPRLVQETGLERQDVINIYTRFVSIYMLQQLEQPNFQQNIDLSQMRKIDLSMIMKTSKTLKLQSQKVVQKMLSMMHLATANGKLSWEEFYSMITLLMPTNLDDQLTLFLKSYVPEDLPAHLVETFEFGKKEILDISRSCLEPLFKVTDDEFFHMLYENYAQIVYNIIGLEWDQDPEKEEKKITLRDLKKCICLAEGYERDMLTLLYGFTGLTSLDEKTEFQQQSATLNFAKETPYVITGLVPKQADRSQHIQSQATISRRNSDLRHTCSNNQSEEINLDSQGRPIPPQKEVLRIGPEDQSQMTKNINIRRHAISQIMQDDRELQFPRYYQSKGHFLNQELIQAKRKSQKFKYSEPDYVQADSKRKQYFSTKALANLSNKNGHDLKQHNFFKNQDKLVLELQKNNQRLINKNRTVQRNLQRVRWKSKPETSQHQNHHQHQLPFAEQIMEVISQDYQSVLDQNERQDSQESRLKSQQSSQPFSQQQTEMAVQDQFIINGGLSADDYMKVMYRRFSQSKKSHHLEQIRQQQNSSSINLPTSSVGSSHQHFSDKKGLILPELGTLQEYFEEDAEFISPNFKTSQKVINKQQQKKQSLLSVPMSKSRGSGGGPERQQHQQSALDNLQQKLRSLEDARRQSEAHAIKMFQIEMMEDGEAKYGALFNHGDDQSHKHGKNGQKAKRESSHSLYGTAAQDSLHISRQIHNGPQNSVLPTRQSEKSHLQDHMKIMPKSK